MVTRRTALRLGSAVTASGLVTGCSGRGMDLSTSLRLQRRFDDVVNAADLGADPTGVEPIDDVLREHLDDDTVVFLPRGSYRMTRGTTLLSFSNVGLVGDGARIVPSAGYSGSLFRLGRADSARGLLVEGVEFDLRRPDTNPRVLLARVTDGLEIKNVLVRGTLAADRATVRLDVTDPRGVGRVERLRLPDGGVTGSGAAGCFVAPATRGTVSFVDCEVAGFPSDGLYASRARGRVRVIGGRYANNGIANVRIGGRSLIRRVRIECSEAPPGVPNMRGIRLRRGEGSIVDGCTVVYTEVTGSDGAITLSPEMTSATVRNTNVRIDTDDVAAIRVKPLADGVDADVPRLVCDDVRISGDAAGGRAVNVADSGRVRLRDVCIEQHGADRDGIRFLDSRDCSVSNSSIDVTGDPIVLERSDVTTTDLCTDPDCCCDSE